MTSYNAPKDEGYSVNNSYAPIKQNTQGSYGSSQTSIILPIYQNDQQTPKTARRSRCPRGANLGEIGSCCGMQCTRACASAGD